VHVSACVFSDCYLFMLTMNVFVLRHNKLKAEIFSASGLKQMPRAVKMLKLMAECVLYTVIKRNILQC
jgi:hypothetical protein